jgi:hypothetical protein
MSAFEKPEPFVDVDAVAAFLCVERRQVLAMTRKGIIPAHPLGTGEHRKVWRYKISEVDATVVSGTRKGGALAQKPLQRTMPPGSPRSQKERSNG